MARPSALARGRRHSAAVVWVITMSHGHLQRSGTRSQHGRGHNVRNGARNVGYSKQEAIEDPVTASGGLRFAAVAVRVNRAETNLSFNLLEPCRSSNKELLTQLQWKRGVHRHRLLSSFEIRDLCSVWQSRGPSERINEDSLPVPRDGALRVS